MRAHLGVAGILCALSLGAGSETCGREGQRRVCRHRPYCLPAPTYWHVPILQGQPAAAPPAVRSSPFFPPSGALDPADPRPAPLNAGERPLVIVVTLAPEELIARTVVTWGYEDVVGSFVQGGQDVLSHRGGVLFAAIPEGVAVERVEVRALVDYAQPQLVDLEYLLRPEVGVSRARAVVQTTSNVIRQRLLLRSVGAIDGRDYLVASFRFRPKDAGRGGGQSGTALLTAAELAAAERGVLEKVVEFPVPPDERGAVDWVIHGRLQGRPVERVFSVTDREAVEVFKNARGDLDVRLGPALP